MTDIGLKLSALLPNDLSGVENTVEQALRKDNNPSHSRLAWRFIRSSAAGKLRDSLDGDLFELVAKAWSKARELYEYGDPQKHPAGETNIVHLGKHEFPAEVHPVLEVRIGGAPCLRLRFTLTVTAHFDSVALSIQGGHITAISPGNAHASAQLKYGDVKLHKPEESPKVALPWRFEFPSPGVRICTPEQPRWNARLQTLLE